MASLNETNLNKRMEEARRLHNKMLYTTIAINYLHSSVDKGIPEQLFRGNFRNHVDDPLSNNAKDVYKMIEILETRGLISLGDYDVLIDIVPFDVRIIEEIESTKSVLYTQGIAIYRRIDFDHVKEFVKDLPHRSKYTIIYLSE